MDTRRRHDELDGYRGLAALAVAAFHVHFLHRAIFGQRASGGALAGLTLGNLDAGVSVFFVLSGFLIAGPFVRACLDAAPLPATRDYLARRAARIVPAYAVAIVVVWALRGGRDWGDLLAHLTFAHIWIPSSIQSIVAPAWSVGVEVCYYAAVAALAPLALRACRLLGDRQRRALLLLGGCAAVIVASWAYKLVAWRAVGFGEGRATIYFGPLARADNFALGCALAVLAAQPFRRHTPPAGRPARLRAAGVAVAAFAGLARFAHPLAYLAFDALCGLAFALVLASTVLGPAAGGRWSAAFARPTPRWLGTISYGVYLWHMPILDALVRAGIAGRTDPGALWRDLALVLGLSVAAGALSYRAIERRFLHRARVEHRHRDPLPKGLPCPDPVGHPVAPTAPARAAAASARRG